jgi:archaetidylinositol phosphate synthase
VAKNTIIWAGVTDRSHAPVPLAEPAGRPEIRDFFGRLFTPLARALANVAPNAITAVSFATGCLAGAAFAAARYGVGWYLVGGALVAISGTCDSLDGLVARMSGRTSRTGDFLDHFGDRVINVAIFSGLAFSPGATPVVGLGSLIITQLNSYLGTQIEATFGVRYYGGLGKAELFVGLIVGSVVLALLGGRRIPITEHGLAPADILFVLLAFGALSGLVHRFRHALRLCAEADTARREPR